MLKFTKNIALGTRVVIVVKSIMIAVREVSPYFVDFTVEKIAKALSNFLWIARARRHWAWFITMHNRVDCFK